MGAWDFVRPSLEGLVGTRRLAVLARPRSSSPAEGSAARSRAESGAAASRRRSTRRSHASRTSRKRRKVNHLMSVNIVVPEVGESIVDARVAKWLKKEGDAVARRRARSSSSRRTRWTSRCRRRSAGVLATIAHGDGADVKIGDVLGTIGEGRREQAKSGERKARKRPAATARRSPARPAKSGAGNRRQTVRPCPRRRRRARLAREQDVELADVEGRRPARDEGGRRASPSRHRRHAAARRQHLAAARTAPPLPSFGEPAGRRSEERVRMSKRRATIARRLVEAQQTAAMLTTFNEVDMTAVMALRERQKETFKTKHGVGARHRVVLRQGGGRRAARVPAPQRRDPGRRDGAQALLRHRRRRRRGGRSRRAGAARRRSPVVRRDRNGHPRLREERRTTAR